MGRAVATVVVVALTAGLLTACASRPSKDGDVLIIPVVDAVDEDVGDVEMQIEVPARDLAHRGRAEVIHSAVHGGRGS